MKKTGGRIIDYLITSLLLFLLILSLYGVYYSQKMPEKEIKFIPAFNYSQKAVYDYKVIVKPNIVYDNRSVLKPNETAYISLVKFVNVSFTYWFIIEPKVVGLTNISYDITCYLESPNNWKKIYLKIPRRTLTMDSSNVQISENLSFNMTNITKLIEAIREETAAFSEVYYLKIVPHISVSTKIGLKPVHEEFIPTMTISLLYSKNRLSFEGLTHNDRKSIGEYQTIYFTNVRYTRFVFYVLSTVFSIALIYHLQKIRKKRSRKSLIDSYLKKYSDIIVESGDTVEKESERTVVRVKSFEDLVKISDESVKPIIHREENGKHIFYVLDMDVRYEYEFLIEEMSKRKKS